MAKQTQAQARATATEFGSDKYNKKHEYILAHINLKPTIEGVYFPPSHCFRADDITWDEEMGQLRSTRYVPGEPSIFVDEQSADDVVPKPKIPIEFVNGRKYVEGREENMLKFLNMHSRNGSNPHRDPNVTPLFYLYEPNKAFKGIIENQKNKAAAESWCFTTEWENVRTFARAMNLPIEGIDAQELRYTLSTYATLDPQKFMDAMQNPSMNRKAVIYDAIDANLLIVNKQASTISWTTGGIITNIPLGADPIDHLVELTFTTEGESFYLTLKGQTYPGVTARERVKPLLSDQPPIPISEDDAFNKLIDEAVQLDVILFKKPWYYYKSLRGQGKTNFRSVLTNADLDDIKQATDDKKALQE